MAIAIVALIGLAIPAPSSAATQWPPAKVGVVVGCEGEFRLDGITVIGWDTLIGGNVQYRPGIADIGKTLTCYDDSHTQLIWSVPVTGYDLALKQTLDQIWGRGSDVAGNPPGCYPEPLPSFIPIGSPMRASALSAIPIGSPMRASDGSYYVFAYCYVHSPIGPPCGGIHTCHFNVYWYLFHFRRDGARDMSFGQGSGVVVLRHTQPWAQPWGDEWWEDPRAFVVRDRLYVAFTAWNSPTTTVFRYRLNGVSDTGFARQGRTSFHFGKRGTTVNNILPGYRGGIDVSLSVKLSTSQRTVLVRLHPDGRLDRRFAHHGVGSYGLGRCQQFEGQTRAAPQGGFLVAGVTYNACDMREVDGAGVLNQRVLIRVDHSGRLVPSFGQNGVVVRTLSPSYTAIVPSSVRGTDNGSIIHVNDNGSITLASAAGKNANGRPLVQPIIERYNADGSPVQSFGKRGIVHYRWCDVGNISAIFDQGKKAVFLVAGAKEHAGTNCSRFGLKGIGKREGVAVLNTRTGRFDQSFGSHGIVVHDPATVNYQLTGGTLDGSGRPILLAFGLPHTPTDTLAEVGALSLWRL